MSTLGVGAFIQGLAGGFGTGYQLGLKQQEMDLQNAKLQAEKAKKDKEVELKQQELDMKVQEKQNKVLKDATDKLEENVIKDANYAVGYYNKMMEDNELPSRKALIIGQDGKEYVTDFDKDTISGYPKIQASLNNKDGMYIVKDGYIHSRNPDGGYTRTNMFGESVDNLKEAFEIKKVGSGTVVLEDGTIVPAYKGIGKKAQDKTPRISVETKVFNERETGRQYSQIAFENKKLLKDFKEGKQLTQEQEIQMQGDEFALNEKANTKEQAQRQEVLDTLDTVENLERIKETYASMNKAGIKGGIAQDATVALMKYIGTGGKFSDITNMDEKKFAQITGLESASTAQRMEIIKNLSGLSYTDKQAEQMALITGDKWGATNEAKFNAIEGYLSDRKKALLNYAEPNNNFSTKNPYTALEIQKKLGGNKTTKEEPNPLLQNEKKVEVKSATGSTADSLWKKIEEKRKQEGR